MRKVIETGGFFTLRFGIGLRPCADGSAGVLARLQMSPDVVGIMI
jgi:hypothetical protein